VVRLFAANEDVAFFDVNLAENQIREGNPGAGGWPTIRYFRKVSTMMFSLKHEQPRN
jgi:hypothetical protein